MKQEIRDYINSKTTAVFRCKENTQLHALERKLSDKISRLKSKIAKRLTKHLNDDRFNIYVELKQPSNQFYNNTSRLWNELMCKVSLLKNPTFEEIDKLCDDYIANYTNLLKNQIKELKEQWRTLR